MNPCASMPRPVAGDAARADALQVRPLRANEGARLKAFFGGLSPAVRRSRFHGAVKELPAAWIEHMTRPDPRTEVALLAEACEDGQVRPVGEARYVADGAPPGTRELAIVVADGWQGRGIGLTLLQLLEQAARRHGVRQLYGDVQRGNLAMLALAGRAGYRTHRHPSDATLVRIVKDVDATADH